MNPASTLSLVAAGVSLYAAVLAARFSRAPGWSEQKWFGLLALVGIGYAVADLVAYLPVSDAVVTVLSQARMAAAAAQAGIWLTYSNGFLPRAPRRRDARVAAGLALAGLPALVPGLAFTGQVVPVAFGSAIYRIPRAMPLGDVLMGAVVLGMAVAVWRFALAARRGVSHAWLHAVGLGTLVAASTNDALAVAGAVEVPFLADLGIVAAIGAVGLALAGRFVDEARVLHGMRERLERAVAERSGALAAREAQLARAELLAALGRLAAGVAHEIAGPAAAAASNVRQLAQDMRRGELPEDALACLEDSEEALARIARTLRMLHDAERVATAPGESGAVRLARAVADAVEAARTLAPDRLEVAAEVPEGLLVKGEWRVVTEVLTLVLWHVWQDAAGGPALVTVRAVAAGDRVRLEVGRAPAAPAGLPAREAPGEALGLEVARALAGSLGGTLEVEGGAGTRLRVVLELPAGYT